MKQCKESVTRDWELPSLDLSSSISCGGQGSRHSRGGKDIFEGDAGWNPVGREETKGISLERKDHPAMPGGRKGGPL